MLTAATTYDAAVDRSFVHATDATTGRMRWTRRALGVLAADRHVTLLRTRHAVEGVDTIGGTMRWRHAVKGFDDARDVPRSAIAGGTVVVLRTGAPALGLDIDTGQVLWRGAVLVDAVAVGGTVVAASEENAEVVALRARTGEVRWTRPVLRPHQELAVTPDHHVLVLDSDFVAHVIEG